MEIFNATLKNAAPVHPFLLARPPFEVGPTMLISGKYIYIFGNQHCLPGLWNTMFYVLRFMVRQACNT
jgi:hypothetical protein